MGTISTYESYIAFVLGARLAEINTDSVLSNIDCYYDLCVGYANDFMDSAYNNDDIPVYDCISAWMDANSVKIKHDIKKFS